MRLTTTGARAFNHAVHVIWAMGGKVKVGNPEPGFLEARLPMSLRSEGERFNVEVSGDDGDVALHVRSRSILPTTLFDFGKNVDNVRRFVTAPDFEPLRRGSTEPPDY